VEEVKDKDKEKGNTKVKEKEREKEREKEEEKGKGNGKDKDKDKEKNEAGRVGTRGNEFSSAPDVSEALRPPPFTTAASTLALLLSIASLGFISYDICLCASTPSISSPHHARARLFVRLRRLL